MESQLKKSWRIFHQGHCGNPEMCVCVCLSVRMCVCLCVFLGDHCIYPLVLQMRQLQLEEASLAFQLGFPNRPPSLTGPAAWLTLLESMHTALSTRFLFCPRIVSSILLSSNALFSVTLFNLFSQFILHFSLILHCPVFSLTNPPQSLLSSLKPLVFASALSSDTPALTGQSPPLYSSPVSSVSSHLPSFLPSWIR